MLSMLHKCRMPALFLPRTVQKSPGHSTRDRKAGDAQHSRSIQRFSLYQKTESKQEDTECSAAEKARKKTRAAAFSHRKSGSQSREETDGGADISQRLLPGVQNRKQERAEKNKQCRADHPGQRRAQETAGPRQQ